MPAFQLRRLTTSDLKYTPGVPLFQQLTADTLGNAATDTDGHDAEFQNLVQLLAGESEGLSTLDADTQAAAFAMGDFEAQHYSPVADELAAAIADAGTHLGDFTAAIGGTPEVNPLPATNPPPPVDLGGGGEGPSPIDSPPPLPPPQLPPDQPPATGPTTPPNVPPEGPGGTLDAGTGTTGTIGAGGSVPPPPELPPDILPPPVDFGPPDVIPPPPELPPTVLPPPVDFGPPDVIPPPAELPDDLPLNPSPFGPVDVLPPELPDGVGGGSFSHGPPDGGDYFGEEYW